MVPLAAGQGGELGGPPLELPPELPVALGLTVALELLVVVLTVALELVMVVLTVALGLVVVLLLLPLVAVPAVEEDEMPPAGEDRVPPVGEEAPLGAVNEVPPVVDILEVEVPGRLLPVDKAVDKLDDDILSEIEMFPIGGL